MWTVAEPGSAHILFASVLYLAAVAVFLSVQEVGLRLRRAEHRAWWAGSGRDLLNAAGVVAIGSTLHLLGLSWSAALLVGGTQTLLLFGTTVFLATQTTTRHPRTWALAAGLVLSLLFLWRRTAIAAAFGRAAVALFGTAEGLKGS
ncbi:MAG TPA: hypothetical protein VFG53_21355 [Anaeromyxobacter sp.]|nr:hypothetical protein [Anaeromyxobacter sp.]